MILFIGANIDLRIYPSLEKAKSAGYEPIGEPARYLADTSKFNLEDSREELLRLADFSFPRIDYQFLLLVRVYGSKNKCTADGFWIQPANRLPDEQLYQEILSGCAIAPHETPEQPPQVNLGADEERKIV